MNSLMGVLVAHETPSCKNAAASNQHFQNKADPGVTPSDQGLALRLPESKIKIIALRFRQRWGPSKLRFPPPVGLPKGVLKTGCSL